MARARRRRPVPPDQVFEIQLGYPCELECLFCSQELSWRRDGWLPLDRARRLVFAARRQGRRALNLLGGEVTLYPGLRELTAFARKAGFEEVSFQTNGLKLADAAFAEGVVSAGVTEVSFSAHGATEEAHDALVGRAGAFARLRAGIANVRRAGADAFVVLVVARRNLGQLEDFCRLFVEELGVRDVEFIFPLYTGEMLRHLDRASLRLSEVGAPLEAALGLLSRLGLPHRADVHNVPPCFMPSSRRRAMGRRDLGMVTAKPDATSRRHELDSPAFARTFARACQSCRLRPGCLGLDPGYVAYWGEGEVRPVR